MFSNRATLKVSAFVLVAGLCTSVGWATNPESIQWITEYSAARRAGIDQGRPVMLFLTMDGCTHCERMIDGAFTDTTVIGSLNKDFVSAQLKLDTEDELAKQLKVTLYPTTVIISTQGKILDYARGYLSPSELNQRLNAAASVRVASSE